jgi:hypothetical protein
MDGPAGTITFRHEALFYEGDEAFVAATLPFIRRGLARDESVLVAVGLPKIEALRDVLDRNADRVEFEDMATLGRNPARIIPAWRDFVDQNADAGEAAGASASRSGLNAVPRNSSSASVTSRYSTWRFPTCRRGTCSVRTTSRRWIAMCSKKRPAVIRS